jgi:serine/threonine-protein kinase
VREVAELRPGEVIGGRYEIVEQLGSGGMARVYRAFDPKLGRDVAVKVLNERYASDPAFVERFRREASAAASLNHPNIVQVFDRGESGGTYYIVMEHLSGPDLKAIIRRDGPLPPLEAVDDALQILSAVGAAHRRDVIHRDIKPQNVLLASDGLLKVTDFGIARAGAESEMTEVGSVIGTAQYLSPEQARGGEVTAASDCYAVGVVLYEMLTGRVPFDGERPVTIAMKHINEPPVPPRVFEPGIPPELEQVVLRALAKRPSERFRTAEDFAAALRDVRAGLEGASGRQTAVMGAPGAGDATRVMEAAPAPTRVQPAPVPDEQPAGRRRGPLLVIGLLVLLGLLAAGAFALMGGGGDDGADTVTVPSTLIGMRSGDAVTEVRGLGLDPVTEQVASSEAERGLVVATTPPPGSEVEAGGRVVLQIGQGPATTAVPDVVGRPQADAVAALEAEGFTARVSRRADDDVPEGDVISQNPRAGAQAAEGTRVTIVVSSGPGQVAVPDVRQRSLTTATQLLQAEGLQRGTVTEQPSTDLSPGTVISQDPGPTTRVDRGSAVNLVVAKAPDQIAVPSVVGLTADQARQKLTTAGFTPLSDAVDSDTPAGQVIDQTPRAGTLVDPGSPVTFTVSLGPATDTEPSVPQPSAPGTTTQGVPAPAPDTGRAPSRAAGARA